MLAHHHTTNAAFHVITSRVLWEQITGFMDGWPFAVLQFRKLAMPTTCTGDSGLYCWTTLPHVAVAANDVVMFKKLHALSKIPANASHPNLDFVDVMTCAISTKSLERMQWTYEVMSTDPDWKCEADLMRMALWWRCHGDLALIRWLVETFPFALVELTEEDCDGQRSLALIECLVNSGHEYPYSSWLMANAVAEGCWELLVIIDKLKRTRGWTTSPALDAAAELGLLDVLESLHSTSSDGTRCSAEAMDRAAENGLLRVVQFLHAHRTEGCTTDAMDAAAARGDLSMVKFLHEHRSEGCTTDAMDEAAAHGHLDVVQYLHQHRSEGCTTYAMDEAAMNGDMNTVRFLHEHRREGCTARAMDHAAANGHLELVRFLHANRTEGCSQLALSCAVARGHDAVTAFLCHNRHEGPAEHTLVEYIGVACRPTVVELLCAIASWMRGERLKNIKS